METNTNNIPGPRYVRILPIFALLLTVIWPKYALAFSFIAQPPPLAFSAQQTIFLQSISASYLYKEGSVLGITSSAYSSEENQTDSSPFTTASGTRVRKGVAAANFLPIGTVIQIENNYYVIEDRLNDRYNGTYRIDIWMESTEDALQHGVQRNSMEIVSLP